MASFQQRPRARRTRSCRQAADHRRIITTAPWSRGGVSFPADVTVPAWKADHEDGFRYQVTKDQPGSAWRLAGAERVDENDKVTGRVGTANEQP